MKRTFYASVLALAVALAAHAQGTTARPGRGQAPTPTNEQLMQQLPLPASDGVLLVELRKLLTQTVPGAVGDNRERLAQINADIEQFKARTGIDAREFDTLAVGSRVVQLPSGAAKIDNTVALARGRFRPEAVAASARAAARGGVAEQQYGGKTLLVFGVNDTLKVFGLAKMRVSELAVAVLDQNTLAVGDPVGVRAAVDAQAGRGRVDQALLNQARSVGGDLVSFAGNVPPFAVAGIDVGLPEVNRSIASIRGFYGGLGTTRTGYHLTTVLRAGNAADAKQLSNTIDALRAIAPGLLSAAGDKARFAKSAIDNLNITAQGSEVRLRTELSQPDVAALIRTL
jgi:hypothetical protein